MNRMTASPERQPWNVPRRWAFGLLCVGFLWAGAASARSFEEALVAGDQAYAAAKLDEAQRAFAEAVQAQPTNLTALCQLSRVESELGETQKGDAQRTTFAAAVSHARDAVRVAPDSAVSHVWLAVALGRQALREGPKSRLAISKEIKSEVDRAVTLDPTIGRAWHVLAMWNVKISSLNAIERMAANAVLGGVPKGASFESAETAFKKAIELEPAYVNHRLEYGRLLKEMKRLSDSRRELEKAISLSPTSSALDARYQTEARALLERLPR